MNFLTILCLIHAVGLTYMSRQTAKPARWALKIMVVYIINQHGQSRVVFDFTHASQALFSRNSAYVLYYRLLSSCLLRKRPNDI